jgi:hypothetical protein
MCPNQKYANRRRGMHESSSVEVTHTRSKDKSKQTAAEEHQLFEKVRFSLDVFSTS